MTAKIDLGKLRKVSSEAAQLQSEVDFYRERDVPMGLGKFTLCYWPAIASTILAQQAQIEALREFAEYALDLCSWDNDPDGGSIQDKAEELKLIELRPIDPEDAIMDETEQYFCVWTPVEPPGMPERRCR